MPHLTPYQKEERGLARVAHLNKHAKRRKQHVKRLRGARTPHRASHRDCRTVYRASRRGCSTVYPCGFDDDLFCEFANDYEELIRDYRLIFDMREFRIELAHLRAYPPLQKATEREAVLEECIQSGGVQLGLGVKALRGRNGVAEWFDVIAV